MNNGDSPINSIDPKHAFNDVAYKGLSKREHFAGLAMAAMLTATDMDGQWKGIDADCAEQAVKEADALLAELERTK